MYFNSGYLNNSRLDFKDYSRLLIVGSCGTYRLKKRPKLPTFWQKGRKDYQILYVAIRIGRNCWLGAGVIVVPGVTIGDDTMIGAGSVVTKDIPANVVV